MGRRVTRRALLHAMLVAFMAVLLFGEVRAERFSGDLPPQPLADALDAFARSTGYQLVYHAELTKGLTSKGAIGGLPAAETLRQLLRDTGLAFEFVNERTITIFKAPDNSTHPTIPPAPTNVRPEMQSGGDGSAPGTVTPDSTTMGDRNVSHRSFFARIAAFVGLCVAASSPACAQQAAAAKADSADNLDEIVVTGSRVIKNGNDSPTPLTVVGTEDLAEVHPATVAEQLNDLPIFSGSRGQYTNTGGGSFGTGPTSPDPAAQTMNLRNMGFTRTLILYDGVRLPPSSPDGTTDVNMIPQMLLQRVEIVTGGASAVYGSDAVTGVVNFITDTKFNGLKVNLNQGISVYGDDRTVDAGIAGGTDLFAGQGHFEWSLEDRHDPGVLSRMDRAWGRDLWTVQGAGTAANPYHLIENTRIGTTSFGGLIGSGIFSGQQFATNGVLSPFVNGAATGTAGYQSGGDGAYNNASLKSSLDMTQLFGRFDYDFTSDVRGHMVVSGTYNHNYLISTSNLLTNATISSTNAFLAPTYQSELAAAGQSSFKLNELFQDVPATNVDAWERQYFVDAGFDGKFGGDYTWQTSFSHSQTQQIVRQNANINNERLSAALDAVTNPSNGQTVCAVTLTNPGLYPGCSPLNVFGPTAASQAAVDYILQSTQYLSTTTMDDVSASVTGAPFSTWAGPVNTALSGEWRREGWRLNSNAQPTDPVSCVGLEYNCSASTQPYADAVTADRSPVSETVREAAIETVIPVLKDVYLAKNVSINGAARYTYYDTSGSATTWKGGLDWQFNDELSFRATRSRDIRAPTLADLYAPISKSTITITDLLTGQSPLVAQQQGGNANLKPEVGYTTTTGFVYKPEWLPSFSFSIDSFLINITNAITSVQGTNPTVQAACYASGGSSPYCALQSRPDGYTNTSAANAVTEWYSEEINISSQKTSGADIEANYVAHVFDHPIAVRFFSTYQPHIIYTTPGLTSIDLGGVAFSSNALQASPVWRNTLTVAFSPFENFGVNIMERERSGLKYSGDPTQIVSSPTIPAVAYTDLNLSYRQDMLAGQVEWFVNVQNLFNKQPPPAAFVGANGAVGTFGGFVYGDDPLGAYFTVGFRYRH